MRRLHLQDSAHVLLDVLTVAVLALVGTRLATSAAATVRSPALRQRYREIVRGLRLHHFARAPLALAAVLIVATALLQVPGLDWGWWTAIGGTGNVIVGGSTRSSLGPIEWIAPVVFVSVLIPLLPLFAEREEHVFREGAEDWSTGRRVRRSVEFGLAHLIMGIPIGVALALSIGGGYFTWAYMRAFRQAGRQAAVLESTRTHLGYNLTIVGVAAVSLLTSACFGGSSSPQPKAGTVVVTSKAFKNGGAIPARYSCKGDNQPPPIGVHYILPRNIDPVTATVVTDPDAPNGTFVHWIEVNQRDLPNSAGQSGYTGMCPPAGQKHHYVFEVLVLRRADAAAIKAAPGTTPINIVHLLESKAVARGTLTGTFKG